MNYIIFSALATACIHMPILSEEPLPTADLWIEAWWDGIRYSQNYADHRKGIAAYTTAIDLLGEKGSSDHLYLYNERGNLHLKTLNFAAAMKDFSTVIDAKCASPDEYKKALWGRSQAYLALGKIAEFEKECQILDAIAPFMLIEETGEKYSVVKIDEFMTRDPKSIERISKVLIMQKKIGHEDDALLSPSSRVLIKNLSQETASDLTEYPFYKETVTDHKADV